MKLTLKKKIILLSSVIVLLLTALVATTVAWLTDTKSSTTNFVMGDVSYDCAFSLNTQSIVVPGEPLFSSSAVVITNKSTVKTNLRAMISITSDGLDASNLVSISLNGNWVKDVDGYWYYISKPTTLTDRSADIDAVTGDTGVTIPFDISMSFDGSLVGKSHSGKTYTVTITIEGKQAEYVLWENMANIDFETGLTKTN